MEKENKKGLIKEYVLGKKPVITLVSKVFLGTRELSNKEKADIFLNEYSNDQAIITYKFQSKDYNEMSDPLVLIEVADIVKDYQNQPLVIYKCIAARNIEGITLNEYEYILDDEGKEIIFASKKVAIKFILDAAKGNTIEGVKFFDYIKWLNGEYVEI